MKNLLLLIVCALGLSSTYAQYSVRGRITDQHSTPLEHVDILIKNTRRGTISDARGNFSINNLSNGTYTLVISMVGYNSKEVLFSIDKKSHQLPTVAIQPSKNELDEVVIDGNYKKTQKPSSSLRLRTPIQKLPQNIQVIPNDLLENQMVTNILEGAFRNVSGVSNIEHWGHFARLNMRGFRLPAFRNGVNIQDSWGPLSEDVFMVDRIEFVKGPSGFMMSAGEPGGFYNVVTKKPTTEKIARVSFMGGSFDTYRGAVDLGGSLTKDQRLTARFNAMYQHTGSHRAYETSSRVGIAPSLAYKISDKTSFLTEFSYQKVNTLIGAAYTFAPVSSGYASVDRNFSMVDSNFPTTDIKEVSLLNRITHQFNDRWSVEAQYVAMNYNQVGASAWIVALQNNGDAIRSVGIWDALSESQFFQLYTNGQFNTGAFEHHIMAGFDFTEKEYFADFSQRGSMDSPSQPFNIFNPTYGDRVFPVFDRSTPLKDRANVYTYGTRIRSLYAQDEIHFLSNRVRVTLAGRYSELVPKDAATISKVTPRLGISADITPQITAYGLYDQSFLAPTGTPRPGVTFDPVEGSIYEVGIKTRFLDNRISSTLTGYFITKNNLSVADPTNATGERFSVQLGEVESKGIEFDMNAQITEELNLLLNYANTNAKVSKSPYPNTVGNRIAGHAKHITNGWLNYQFNPASTLKGFGISLGYQYQIDRSTWAWAADNQTDLPDYFRLDGALSWQHKQWRVGVNVNNILNKYLYSGANYSRYLYWQSEPGINGRVAVSYSF